MSTAPVPSNLVLLSDLPTYAPGTKVRFLGCVDEYVVQTGTLRLKHNNPVSAVPVIANVDIEHVLEHAKQQHLEVGTWLNVIGYVQRKKEKGVFVQAVTIWDAGNVDLDAYAKAVQARKGASLVWK